MGVGPSRAESLLGAWGGRSGTRYTRLFDADHPLEVKYGAESPWTFRPPLAELLDQPDLDSGMQAARDHGYRLTEIAEAVGLSPSRVSRRTMPRR